MSACFGNHGFAWAFGCKPGLLEVRARLALPCTWCKGANNTLQHCANVRLRAVQSCHCVTAPSPLRHGLQEEEEERRLAEEEARKKEEAERKWVPFRLPSCCKCLSLAIVWCHCSARRRRRSARGCPTAFLHCLLLVMHFALPCLAVPCRWPCCVTRSFDL